MRPTLPRLRSRRTLVASAPKEPNEEPPVADRRHRARRRAALAGPGQRTPGGGAGAARPGALPAGLPPNSLEAFLAERAWVCRPGPAFVMTADVADIRLAPTDTDFRL